MRTRAVCELRLDRYRILDEIGRGSMGVVYKARDLKFDRLVAIKTLSLFGQLSDLEYRERFRREAISAGKLSHPAIVTVFDFGEDPQNQIPYIVMEYIAGRTLEERLSDPTRLPLPLVLRLIQEIAEALHYSHQRGVIHRDVKPGNIMVTEENHAKLADFGVAKFDVSNLTIAGQLFGTPAYMSPEQLLGGVVDGRSDLFSLGAVLYCMVAGYKPFQGNGASTITFKVINREPLPVTTFDTQFPASLDRIVRRALAKEPEQRYQSGAQMSADLQEVRDELVTHAKNSDLWRYTPNLDRTGDTAREASKPEHRTGAPEPDILAAQNPAIHPTQQSHSASKSTRVKTYLLIGSGLVLLAAVALSVVVSRFQLRHEEHSLSTATQPLTSAQARAPVPARVVAPVAAASDTADEPIAADITKKVVQKQSYAPKRVARHSPTAVGDAHISGGMAAAPADKILATTSTNEQLPRSRPPSSVLDVVIDNHFVDAQLFVWIDDNLLLQDALHAEVKRSLVLFRKVDSENHRRINVPSGNHRVAVRVQSVSSSFDGRDTTSANFQDDRPTMLTIDFEGTNKLRLAVH
jgi:serine/threonine protein kinase